MTQQAYLDRISGCLVTMQMAVDEAEAQNLDDQGLWAALEEQTQKMAFVVMQADKQTHGADDLDDDANEPDFDFANDDEDEEASA